VLSKIWRDIVKYTQKLSAFLCLSVLLGCEGLTAVKVDAASTIDQPPPPMFCEPGEDPQVNVDLVGNCTSMTQDFGDWYLTLVEYGKEKLGWKYE
jgi:hypothetical protein